MARNKVHYSIEYQGLDVALRRLSDTERKLNHRDGTYFLRDEAGRIARTMMPTVKQLVAGSPAPQGRAMAATVRVKRDRLPVVRVGATNPRLSGFRRGGRAKQHKGSIAWGSERGPHPATGRNPYTVARNGGGYVIGPNLSRITGDAADEYRKVLTQALRRVGVI